MTATDAALIALGERFEKLLLEHMDAWLEWALQMRAAHAKVRDNMAAKLGVEQDTFHDRAQAGRAGLAHALFARKVQRKLRNGVAGFAAAGSSLDQRVREARDAGRRARAAYHRRRSSNANGLRGQNSAGFPQINATFQRDHLRRHF
jgi:hypothetical protein